MIIKRGVGGREGISRVERGRKGRSGKQMREGVRNQ